MALSRKGSKRITVDGADYRWAVSTGSGFKVVVVQCASGHGQRLEAQTSFRSDFRELAVGPAGVRSLIEWAKEAGWPSQGATPPMRINNADERISELVHVILRFVVKGIDGSNVAFGPLQIREEFRKPDGSYHGIDAAISITTPTGTWHVDNVNGIGPDAFPMLRQDLETLRGNRSGRVSFGTHDQSDVVEIVGSGNEFKIFGTDSFQDLWSFEVGTMRFDDLKGLIEQIDRIENYLAPMTGHCGHCGPARSHYEEWLTPVWSA